HRPVAERRRGDPGLRQSLPAPRPVWPPTAGPDTAAAPATRPPAPAGRRRSAVGLPLRWERCRPQRYAGQSPASGAPAGLWSGSSASASLATLCRRDHPQPPRSAVVAVLPFIQGKDGNDPPSNESSTPNSRPKGLEVEDLAGGWKSERDSRLVSGPLLYPRHCQGARHLSAYGAQVPAQPRTAAEQA